MTTQMPGRDPGSLRYGATKETPKGPGARQTPVVGAGRGASGDTGKSGNVPHRGAKFEGPGKK